MEGVRLTQLAMPSLSAFISIVEWSTRPVFPGIPQRKESGQIFIYGTEVTVGHVSIDRPWHYLQIRPELRMSVIRVDASA